MELTHTARGIERVTDPISIILDSAGRVILALMVTLISLDVILRYFFNRPIKGSYELVEFMLVVLVYLGLAYTQTKKGHISITLFSDKLSPAQLAVVHSATNLSCVGIFSIISWRCVLQAQVLWENETASGVLFIPNFPFMWVVVVGSVLLSLVFLKDFIESLDAVLKKCSKAWLWFAFDAILVSILFAFPIWMKWLPWDLSRPAVGVIGIILLILLLFSSMPIGPVMALIGFVGFATLVNINASLSILSTSPYRSATMHSLSTIPLFMLMGLLCFHAELSKDIYRTLRNWMGRLPGGLAMSTVGGCAGFAAVSGSSLATAVTMGTIALPEMRRYKYDDGLACGSIAAGGSIGILIPPSFVFIIYASLTEESIGRLFIAGVFPGLMEAVFYILTIYIICKIKPSMGPPGAPSTWREKIVSLKDTWGILVLFFLVIGGIYGGMFTPTEAAGVGAFGAFLLGMIKRKFTLKKILDSLAEATRNTAMLMLMLVGADIFGYFLTISQIPFILAEFVVGLPVHSAVTMSAILCVYIVLGCIMPIIPAIILTVPIFFPVVTGLGYDPIWFGVITVTMAEMGQITPPVGINVFVLAGVAKDVPLSKIFKGILPFVAADVVRVILIFFLPAIALWLPSLMG